MRYVKGQVLMAKHNHKVHIKILSHRRRNSYYDIMVLTSEVKGYITDYSEGYLNIMYTNKLK